MIRQLDDRTLVSGQIAPHEVAGLAEHGVTVLVNNRPDGEEPGQPLAADIEAAAAAAGIAYRFVPIIRGIGPADVEEMQEALRDAGDGKLLAFCRSGTRSALVWRARQARGRAAFSSEPTVRHGTRCLGRSRSAWRSIPSTMRTPIARYLLSKSLTLAPRKRRVADAVEPALRQRSSGRPAATRRTGAGRASRCGAGSGRSAR